MSAPSDDALFLALTLALAIASPAAAQKRTSALPKAEVDGSEQLNWEAEAAASKARAAAEAGRRLGMCG